MKAGVVRPDPVQEFYTPERCYILELSNSLGDEALSIACARVEPRVTTAFHNVLDTVERYLILEGEGLVELIFLALCTPRFQQENSIATE
jgi:hypothetical protein